MQSKILMIPIEFLEHHPKNPRKDLGDLEELADSIKAQGVLQNLTVVPYEEREITKEEQTEFCKKANPHNTDEQFWTKVVIENKIWKFWVLIGNRRLEAARQAELTHLPCRIVEMPEEEQIATMLAENMQRTDLTVYEQAKGIQTMLDLGFDKEEIGKRTGFSRTTIDRRLAVASLPDQETMEAVDAGWDLLDLVEISKIDDEETKKRLLINTQPSMLKQAIKNAQTQQVRNRNEKRLIPEIEKFAEKMKDPSDRYGSKYERVGHLTIDLDDETSKVKVPEDAGKQKYIYLSCWGSIEFFKPAKREKREKTEQEIALERRKHDARELNERMRENRVAFVASFTPTKMQEAHLKTLLWEYIFDNVSSYESGGFKVTYHSWDSSKFRQFCGMPKEEGRDQSETILSELKRRNIPMGRAILAWILCGGVKCDDRDGYANQYDGSYKSREEDMDEVYRILADNGYQLSEEENQWKEGTHQIYRS